MRPCTHPMFFPLLPQINQVLRLSEAFRNIPTASAPVNWSSSFQPFALKWKKNAYGNKNTRGLNVLFVQNDWVCLVKVTRQREQESALDIPPVNRESRGFSCLTVLLSNCGAWLLDFIVTGHRGKRDFGSSLMLSKFRLNETGKPFWQRKTLITRLAVFVI